MKVFFSSSSSVNRYLKLFNFKKEKDKQNKPKPANLFVNQENPAIIPEIWENYVPPNQPAFLILIFCFWLVWCLANARQVLEM